MPTDPPGQLELDLVHYAEDGTGGQDFALRLGDDTLWASRAEIAALFRAPEAAVARHIAAIYAEGELLADETRRTDGAGLERFGLDLILSVGYRLDAKRATAFRRWADGLLRRLMIQGFVLDEARLRENRSALDGLAARLRALRSDEANIYETVRRAFSTGAEDYDDTSEACRRFVARLEDNFVLAATGETPPEILMHRADHARPGMGLERAVPTMDAARIAQNYLDGDELFRLHLLCEQFLLLVEQHALRGRRMTMADLDAALEGLLRLDGHPVLRRHKAAEAARAVRHAEAEYARFMMRRKQRAG